MDDSGGSYATIDANFATNLRAQREAEGLSQEDLAQRMSEQGFGFSQATIWKIEQGKRPVKISEAVALAKCLGLLRWGTLVQEPQHAQHEGHLQRANRATFQAYEQLKAAAAQYIEAQLGLAIAVRAARDDGADVFAGWTSWLDTPAERAVIEARIEGDRHDRELERVDAAVDQVLDALRQHGYDATINPQALEVTVPG